MAVSRISELASLINASTAHIDDRLNSKRLPSPSFSPNQPFDPMYLYDEDIAESRQALLEATDELHYLMLGPVGILTSPSVRTVSCPAEGTSFNDERVNLAQFHDQPSSDLSLWSGN